MNDSTSPDERKPAATALVSVLVAGTILLYPILVYFGIQILGLRFMAVVLIAVFLTRLILLRLSRAKESRTGDLRILAIAGVVLALVSAIADSASPMLYYPVVVNVLLLGLFLHSVLNPPTVIERIARRMDKDFSESAVAYTRNVTIAWVVFFALNGSVSLGTVLAGSTEVWAFYNGFVSYVLIGTMFGGEWIIRRWVRRRKKNR